MTESVGRWASAKKAEIDCLCFMAPNDLLEHLKSDPELDVLLLDISFGEKIIDGMQVARYIRKMGNQVPIIFVTSVAFRAPEGYLVEAAGYLSKPIDERRLALFLNRILKQNMPDKIIQIATESGVTNVRLLDVIYAEVNDHTIIFHTTHFDVSKRGTLGDIVDLLGRESFIQIHRSYVIAIEKIHKVKTTYPYSVQMMESESTMIPPLPVSRKFIDKLLEIYADDIWERMI